MIEDKIICKKSDLTSIADTVRSKLGVTDTYYVSELSDAIERIPTGTQLPTLSNPGTSADLVSGKELIDQNGNKVTGTIATKTSSDITASGATVTVPAGYYASSVSKSVSTATQATPSITVNSSGLITASATQSAGYVSSGTKSATKQLTTQPAKTITPSTSNQTAVDSGRYTTGVVTVQGDSNLVATNIKSGVSIFGISGTYEGSGGGGSQNLQSKSVTYTSNGTATVTPDSEYDGLSSVDVTVNVVGSNTGYNIKKVSYSSQINKLVSDVTIEHNCGTIPKFVGLDSDNLNANYLCPGFGCNESRATSFYLREFSEVLNVSVTSTTFTISGTSRRYAARKKYTYYFFY